MTRRMPLVAAVLMLAFLGTDRPAQAVWWVTYGSWDSQTRKDAADAAMLAVVNRFNAYGDFNWGNDGWVDVYYNAGVPTAQASYYGSVEFGGTWPNERVTQHEMNHWFGTGTYWNWANQFSGGVWAGPKVATLIKQFDGDNAVIRQSGYHFYPYGLNYDSEVVNDATLMRNVAITYAMRQDMGNGNPANPWSAIRVTLTGSDPLGTSAFNWYGGGWSGASYPGWDDKYVPHAGGAYFTSDYMLRTPLDSYNPGGTTPSFTFGGTSLTVNNTNGASGGLLFKGVGTTGVVTIPNLVLDGGYVRHASGAGDLFQLAGTIVLRNRPTIDAAQGNIRVLGSVSGTGTLTVAGRYSVTLAAAQNTYSGGTVVQGGTLVLANGGGVGAIRGALTINSGATVRLAAADALGWQNSVVAVTEIDIAGTLDNAVNGNNGYLASWTLTGGTVTASGGGSYQIRAGLGKSITSLASSRTSYIRADVAIRDAGSTLPIIVEDGPASSDLWITGALLNSPFEAGRNGVRKEGAGTLVLAGANTYTGPTAVQGGTLRVANAAAVAASPVTVDPGGTLLVSDGLVLQTPSVTLAGGTLSAGSLRVGTAGIGQLTIASGLVAGEPTVSVGAGGLISLAEDISVSAGVATLTVDASAGGLLDLGAGEVAIAAGGITAEALRADILAGRAGGDWSGAAGITSSLAAASRGTRAVGYLVRTDGTAVTSFAAPGDIDLNGQVDVFDLVGINGSGTYGSGGTADWSDGDGNYDGVTNVFDLVGINSAGAYGQGHYLPASPPPLAPAVVPEPAGFLLVAGAAGVAAGLIRRPAVARR